VIYNLPLDIARGVISSALLDAGLRPTLTGRGIEVGDAAWVELSSFPALRNVSLRCVGGEDAAWQRFEHALHERIEAMDVEPSPMAVALLLVATAMIVTPMILMAHQAPEIVRLLTDLLP
jgi:hypothetical protein